MLLFVTALFLWLPALGGWALPWAWLRLRLGGPGWQHYDGGDGVGALAVLAALSVLVNFVAPLNTLVSGLVLLVGWLLLALRFYLARPSRPAWRLGLPVLAWIIGAALLANLPPAFVDSGLYHLQSILWAHASALPLGLANLHGRFGFNSVATPLAALLQLPLWGQTTLTSPNLLGPLLLCAYGAELLAALRRRGPRLTRTTLFLALGAILPWAALQLIFSTVNAPTTDWPVMVLTLLAVALALRAFDDPTALVEAFAGTLLIAVFAVTFKLSALPLLGLPVTLGLYALRQRRRLPSRPLLALAASLGLGLGLPWVGRGLALSGCVAYPMPLLCFPSWPWAVPLAQATNDLKWIASWARLPGRNFAITLHGWGWLPAWLSALGGDLTFLGSILLLGVGVSVWAAVRRSPTTATDRSALLVIGAPLFASLVYWFVTAPDIRFVAGSFWSLGLLAVSLGYNRLAQAERRGRGTRVFQMVSLIVCALLLLSSVAFAGWQALLYLSNAGPVAYLLDWPALKPTPTTTMITTHGDAVLVPTDTNQCWLAPLPCTPYFNPALVITRDAAGVARQFSVAPP